jgi:hypothetical protein
MKTKPVSTDTQPKNKYYLIRTKTGSFLVPMECPIPDAAAARQVVAQIRQKTRPVVSVPPFPSTSAATLCSQASVASTVVKSEPLIEGSGVRRPVQRTKTAPSPAAASSPPADALAERPVAASSPFERESHPSTAVVSVADTSGHRDRIERLKEQIRKQEEQLNALRQMKRQHPDSVEDDSFN